MTIALISTGITVTFMPAVIAYQFFQRCVRVCLWPTKMALSILIPKDMTETIAKTRQEIRRSTQTTIKPVIGSIKINVIRLIIASVVVCFSISFATAFYAAVYWYFIPKYYQETQIFF